ncbi:cytochrome c oxidase assembly protein [Anaerobacillus sp. CMMVII]|uniref:cytochrome c oxidase assembly protein n=1 Tax=Anaerobacillus sp. CMMVII TaxID=2755588 RepID=UPI0021B814F1|nr:cytochrome c oxidase assembly protein [Anaerobacillus sp. CMMVII]MCT8138028.1 cytochrome c oxidase assembly protein [Anaerobacillus sp. CMMVII]
MTNETHIHHVSDLHIHTFSQLLLALPFLVGFVLYLYAVIFSNRYYKQWPFSRTMFWSLGVIFATAALVGPLAERAQTDFTVHMVGHLLLGMAAPLLMVLAAPMTLLMRTLKVEQARRLTRLLKSRIVHFYTDPVVASILNIGGLWILYTTGLYEVMHHSLYLHMLIHIHVFLAGFLFTVSLIGIDPTPYKRSYVYRSVVAVTAFSIHGILSKYIYAFPPSSVPVGQAELGSMIMYYGGDVIDAFLFFILCLQWFRTTRPRLLLQAGEF